ncbi:hypothetical protein PFISCL1PPCAC_27655, partial [Pristionchus fissidentatus]
LLLPQFPPSFINDVVRSRRFLRCSHRPGHLVQQQSHSGRRPLAASRSAAPLPHRHRSPRPGMRVLGLLSLQATQVHSPQLLSTLLPHIPSIPNTLTILKSTITLVPFLHSPSIPLPQSTTSLHSTIRSLQSTTIPSGMRHVITSSLRKRFFVR